MNDIDSQLQINSLYEDLAPPGRRKVAVIIGRFNPPTRGHYSVISEAKRFIRQHKNLGLDASPVVVVIGGSKSDSDKKRNPLSVEERILFMQSSGHANGVIFKSAKNAFDAFAQLRQDDLEPIAFAAGEDRADDYLKILDKHFLDADGNPIKHYKIELHRDKDAVETNSSGKNSAFDSALEKIKKDNDVDDDIISASLARYAVSLGYEPEFAKIVGLESKPALAKKMFDKIAAVIKE